MHRGKRIFMAHQHAAARDFARVTCEVVRRAAAQVHDFGVEAGRRRRCRAEQGIARERGAVGQRELHSGTTPARIGNLFNGRGRGDRSKTCTHKIQSRGFAGRAGTAAAEIAQRGKIALHFGIRGERGQRRGQ